jgi:sensor domain CHASE-containing protein
MAGPLGTAIGVGVGIVVGVMVDWWMTEQFQAELENDLQQYLTKLRHGMIEGVNGQPGLRQFLSTFNDDLSQVHRATMYHRLVGEYS